MTGRAGGALSGLNTDLYELTMAAAYFESGRFDQWASFELFTRRLPDRRRFLVAAGLAEAVDYLRGLSFDGADIDFLRSLPPFEKVGAGFWEYLRELSFSGRLRAVAEGTLVFPDEPLAQVSGPVIEAQIAETMLINLFNLETMVASKAARLRLAAGDRSVVDFGGRRAHGPGTAVLAARAAYLGGCDGTSNVLASRRYRIPCFGTMAHSYVEFFDDEAEAFDLFRRLFPEHAVLLVDTYDTLDGVRAALSLQQPFAGIRLDSGDLGDLAQQSRRLLDEAGRHDTEIFASGGLNEARLQELGASPIDGYGVGTELVVSADAPSCELVYKLVSVDGEKGEEPRRKTSPSKVTLPFRKQVYRPDDWAGDILAREGEAGIAGRPLMETFLEAGSLVRPPDSLKRARRRVLEQLDSLPERLRALSDKPAEYPVELSAGLQEL